MIDLPLMCNHSPIPSRTTPPPLYAINYVPSGYLYTSLWSKVFFFSNTIISLNMAALRRAWVIPFPPLRT